MCLGSTLLLSGCATYTDPVREGNLNLECVSSQRAKVGYAYVQEESGKYLVRGTVKKRFARRGSIPGHVHITLIDSSGEVLSDTPARYMRKSVKSRSADFHLQLPVEPPIGSALRVTHQAKSCSHAL